MTPYHREADVGLLERGSVVGPVPRDRHDLPGGVELAADDALDEGVLVLGGGASQHA